MTGAPRAVGLLAAALIGAGLAFDLPSLYEPGAALALLIVGARMWVALAARDVRARRIRQPCLLTAIARSL